MVRKTALITGASRGLGKELALVFAKNSWDLIINGRNKGLLSGVKSLVSANGVRCDVVVGDLASDETIVELGEAARRREIDAFVNNAGVYTKGQFLEMEVPEIERMVRVNLLAPMLLTREVYPIFRERRSGLIVNINSVAGEVGSPLEAVYCATKHGLRGFADSLKYEATSDGVRIINIFGGGMQTDMTRERDTYGKLMKPSEVADIIYAISVERPSVRVDRVTLGRTEY